MNKLTPSKLTRCVCGAFLAPGSNECPSCRVIAPTWAKRAAVVVGSAAIAMTLSACYGAAYVEDDPVPAAETHQGGETTSDDDPTDEPTTPEDESSPAK